MKNTVISDWFVGGGVRGADGDEGDRDNEEENEEDLIKKAQSQLEEEKKALLDNHSLLAEVIMVKFESNYPPSWLPPRVSSSKVVGFLRRFPPPKSWVFNGFLQLGEFDRVV